MNRILVTGAGGFVGQHLLRRLAGGPAAIRALSRQPASTAPAGIDHRLVDLESTVDLDPLLSQVSVVVHLAARAHVLRDASSDPLGAFRAINRDLTLRLARSAARNAVRRFVFVSTIGVLGEGPHRGALRETDLPRPQTPYARSKWEAEEGLRVLAAETGLEVVIVRPPLVHGPGAPGNLARLLALVDRLPILPFGAIHNRRSFAGVANLCDLLIELTSRPEAAGQTFLAADEGVCSTPELVGILAAARGRQVRSAAVPLRVLHALGHLLGRAEDIDRLTGSLEIDTSFIRSRLAWRPRVGLQEGLVEMARAWDPRR